MWRRNSEEEEEEEARSESVASSSFAGSQSQRSDNSPSSAGDDGGGRYSGDEFDGYSDEFESEDDAEDDTPPATEDGSTSVGVLPTALRVGDRVQVYWAEDAVWFDGLVDGVDGQQCFVRYDDGETQWEDIATMRVAPSGSFTGAQQLQELANTKASSLVGRRVAVFWNDEYAWFYGSIRHATAPLEKIFVAYDDGDDQWIPRDLFKDVLVLKASLPSPLDQDLQASATTIDRIIAPRQYTPAVEHHFQPVRVARAYTCAVSTHIGSIIRPRTMKTPSRCPPVHVALEYTAAGTGDAQVQTEITTASA